MDGDSAARTTNTQNIIIITFNNIQITKIHVLQQ